MGKIPEHTKQLCLSGVLTHSLQHRVTFMANVGLGIMWAGVIEFLLGFLLVLRITFRKYDWGFQPPVATFLLFMGACVFLLGFAVSSL